MKNVKFLRITLIAIIIVFLLAFTMVSILSAPNGPEWKVDANGNVTVDGQIYRIKGGSWFGLEGRHEPSNDPDNPSGAPMELYIGNVFWQSSSRTHDSDIAEFKQMGFNTIRIPISPQTLDPDDEQAQAQYKKNTESVRYDNSYEELCAVIEKCDAAGVNVMIDIHSCSNYVGWRAGRLDARPPYVDNTREDYDFMRENCSCSASGNPSGVEIIQAYDKSKWVADLKKVAGLSEELGVDNIMGIDIFNEPWDYTWAEWSDLIDTAYDAVSSVDPNILIFAQGIGSTNGNQDGSPNTKNDTPHGDKDLNPNWGENLYEAGDNPPSMPKDKLVFTPHTYGPSVFVQRMFMDPAQPECAGLEEEAAAENECNIVINPEILEAGWEEHFGYLRDLGYAVCIGEWGGNREFPNKAELRKQDMFGYLTDKTTDWQWQQALVNYMLKKGITDSFYWGINPESGDTGGMYNHAYDPVSNTGGWGTWTSIDQTKVQLLQKLWGGSGTTTSAPRTTSTTTTTVPRTTSTTTTTVPRTTSTSASVTATVSVVNDWGSGGQLKIVVKNNGSSATNGWSVTVNVPGTIVNIWGGKGSGSGNVTITNEAWNGSIPAGGSVEVGAIYSK